jgi:hypothetical protein
VFFRHAFQHDGAPPKDHGFGTLPRWAVELNTFGGVLAAPPPESPSHEHLPGDYVLKSPADTHAGCDVTLVPTVESTIRRPIMGATNMGTMKPDPLMPMISEEKSVTKPSP